MDSWTEKSELEFFRLRFKMKILESLSRFFDAAVVEEWYEAVYERPYFEWNWMANKLFKTYTPEVDIYERVTKELVCLYRLLNHLRKDRVTGELKSEDIEDDLSFMTTCLAILFEVPLFYVEVKFETLDGKALARAEMTGPNYNTVVPCAECQKAVICFDKDKMAQLSFSGRAAEIAHQLHHCKQNLAMVSWLKNTDINKIKCRSPYSCPVAARYFCNRYFYYITEEESWCDHYRFQIIECEASRVENVVRWYARKVENGSL